MRKDFPNIALASTEKVEDGLDPKEARTGKSVLGLESVEKGKLPDDRPTVFRLSAHDTVEEIKRRLDCEIQDDYRDHYLNELFEIRNPQVRLDTVEGYEKLQEYLSKR